MPFHRLRDKVVRPQDLCFTQDSISVTFKRPREQERIDCAVDLIIRGKLSPKAFPQMNVVEFQHRLWSLDNRRLWVFKKAAVGFVTVTLVAFDYGNGFQSLVSTSPYLYSTLSRPDFFPRIRGHCKETFSIDDPGMPFSVPCPPPPPQARPSNVPSKIYRNSAPSADPFCVPRPDRPPKRPKSPPPPSKVSISPSKLFAHFHDSNDNHYHLPSQFKNSDECRRRGPSEAPRVRSLVFPPPPSKHLGSEHGPSLPKSKKRPHDSSERLHTRAAGEFCSCPPARNCRAPCHHAMREQVRACPPRPSRTPHEECSPHPPPKKLRTPIHHRGIESRTSSPAPRPPVPSPPLQKSKGPPRLARAVRAPSPPRRASTPTSAMKSRRVTRSVERLADRAANRPSCRSTNVLSSDQPRSREKRTVKLAPPTPLSKDRNPPRVMAASSTSRAATRAAPRPPPAQPATKRSRTSKPMSNAKNFSYDFHSSRKKPKAPKKTVPSPITTPPSTPSSDPALRPSSGASPESSPVSSKMAPEPHPSHSTRGGNTNYTAYLPSPPVPAPQSPPLTRRAGLKKLGQQSAPSGIDGNSIHHSIFGKSPTETRLEPSGRVDFSIEGGLLSETEMKLFSTDQQASHDGPGPRPPGNELSPQDRQTLDAIVELFLRDVRNPLVPTQTNRTAGTPENELTEPEISAAHLPPPSQMPTDAGVLKQRRDEPQDMSGLLNIDQSVFGRSFHYVTKGQSLESTVVHGVGDIHRAAANVDVTKRSATGLEPPELQAWTPVTGVREVRKTPIETRVGKASDEKAHPVCGNEVWEVSKRITRSEIKKQEEMKRRREREQRKKARREEREAKATKERRVRSLPNESSEVGPINTTTDIVPYQPERREGVSSGMITVVKGDMVYVKVNGKFYDIDAHGVKNSKKIRLHPYLRIIGPFKVARKFSAYAAVLELPDDCHMKPIFSLKLLLKSKSPLVDKCPETRLSINLVPETILKKRVARRLKKRKVLHYLVKWKTLPATEATWEPETIFDEYPHLLDKIESTLPLFSNPYMFRNWQA